MERSYEEIIREVISWRSETGSQTNTGGQPVKIVLVK
jgi:hypothetical protein